jgi:hypothetical protein
MALGIMADERDDFLPVLEKREPEHPVSFDPMEA